MGKLVMDFVMEKTGIEENLGFADSLGMMADIEEWKMAMKGKKMVDKTGKKDRMKGMHIEDIEGTMMNFEGMLHTVTLKHTMDMTDMMDKTDRMVADPRTGLWLLVKDH